MSLSRQPYELEETANSPSSRAYSVPPVASSRDAAAPTSAATAEIVIAAAAAATAAETAGAASYQRHSELDQGALQQVLIRLPRNVIVLTAKVLNKGCRDWVYQQLGSRSAKEVVICGDDLQSFSVPVGALSSK